MNFVDMDAMIRKLSDLDPDEHLLPADVIEMLDDFRTSGWVPVEKDLPEPGELVLITCQPKGKAANVNRAWCDKEGVWHGSGSMSTVVAWMPMPVPYDGGKR